MGTDREFEDEDGLEYDEEELEDVEEDFEDYDEDDEDDDFDYDEDDDDECDDDFEDYDDDEYDDDDDEDEIDFGISKEGVAQAADDFNAIYKEGAAAAKELKDAFADIKSAFGFKDLFK